MHEFPPTLIVAGGPGGEAPVSLASAGFVFANAPNPVLLLLNSDLEFCLSRDFDSSIRVEHALGCLREGLCFQPLSALAKELQHACLSDAIVFPLVHGRFGEDGRLQSLFEALGYRVCGSSSHASVVCWDKLLCKLVLQNAGLPVVPFRLVRADQRLQTLPFGDQLHFVKPAREGSSLGVQRVGSVAELNAAIVQAAGFDSRILVEPAVQGRELEVAVLESVGKVLSSRVGEICLADSFYSFESKYAATAATETKIADLNTPLEALIRSMASRAFEVVEGSGFMRVDFFLDNQGHLFINELNNLPGMTEISMFPTLWKAEGLGPAQLIRTILKECMN